MKRVMIGAVVLAVSLAATAVFGQGVERRYEDVDPVSELGLATEWAATAYVMGGYPDGSFRPDLPLTRGQLAKILWRYDTYLRVDEPPPVERFLWYEQNGLGGWTGLECPFQVVRPNEFGEATGIEDYPPGCPILVTSG